MSENNDENQKDNPEPWKDLPEMERLPAPYEQFKKDVEPYAVDLGFWYFCYQNEIEDQFLITDRRDLETLHDYKEVLRSNSFFWETYEKAGRPSEEPLWLVGPDGGFAHRLLFRFLDGGYALVGNNSPSDAYLSIVPLSELTDDKIYLSQTTAIREKKINELVDQLERFRQFAKDTMDLVKRWHSGEEITRGEMDARGIQDHMIRLYRSDHAASIHRSAVFYKHLQQEMEENPDPEGAPE